MLKRYETKGERERERESEGVDGQKATEPTGSARTGKSVPPPTLGRRTHAQCMYRSNDLHGDSDNGDSA
jgi:hypothetical protein